MQLIEYQCTEDPKGMIISRIDNIKVTNVVGETDKYLMVFLAEVRDLTAAIESGMLFKVDDVIAGEALQLSG